MNSKLKKLCFTFFFLCLISVCWGQSIDEIRNLKPVLILQKFNYSARSMAMGGTITASRDPVSAIFNPAGIDESDQPVLYGNYERGKMDYLYDYQKNSAGDGYVFLENAKVQGTSFLSISVPVKIWDRRWTFGLTYYRWLPHGANGRGVNLYEPVSGDNNSNHLKISGSKGIDVLAFTTAVRFGDYLSIGATVQQFMGKGTSRYEYFSQTYSYKQVYTEKVKSGRNIIAGLLFTPIREITIGFSWQNRFNSDFTSSYHLTQGDTKTNVSIEPTITIPDRYSAGVVFRPLELVKLSFDYSRYFWSKSKLSSYHSVSTELPYPGKGLAGTSQSDLISRSYGVEIKIPMKYGITGYIRGGHLNALQIVNDKDGKSVGLKTWSFGGGVEWRNTVRVDAAYSITKGGWQEAGFFDSSIGIDTDIDIKRFAISIVYRLPFTY